MGSNIQKKWILEFLLRQPIEDNDMIPILSALGPSCQDHRLMKTLLLRRVSSEIQKDLVSEKILESLELIEELDSEKGIETLDSMKEAYCAVVAHCAMMVFKEDLEDKVTLWNIWKGRLFDMEKGMEDGLLTIPLNDLQLDLDDEVRKGRVCGCMSDSKSVALTMIRKFLEEAMNEIGPSFLDLASKTVREYEEAEALNSTSIANEVEVRQDLVEEGKKVFPEAGSSLIETILKAAGKELGGAKVSTNTSIDAQIGTRREDTIVAQNENSDTNRNDISGNLDVGICDGNPQQKDVSGNVERESGKRVVLKDNQVVRCDNTRNQAARQSLMERNSTAHAYRWEDDDIECSSEGSANPQHPTVKKKSVSSLIRRPAKVQTGRRKKRKWSSIEEQTLFDAVKEYGVGNWALILEKHREIFEERTGGDLKDKWRNLTK